MTGELLTIDRQPIEEGLNLWRGEQEELAAGYRESLEALDAYQKHLDTWHNQLAAQRDELNSERARLAAEQEQLAQDRARLNSERQTGSSESEQVARLQEQLAEAREKITNLSSDLLSKTEELRKLDNARAEMTTQVEILRVREQNLVESLEKERTHLAEQQESWNVELQQLRDLLETHPSMHNLEPRPQRSSDPVVGSIVAQFNKLRQQQALGRRPPVKK